MSLTQGSLLTICQGGQVNSPVMQVRNSQYEKIFSSFSRKKIVSISFFNCDVSMFLKSLILIIFAIMFYTGRKILLVDKLLLIGQFKNDHGRSVSTDVVCQDKASNNFGYLSF